VGSFMCISHSVWPDGRDRSHGSHGRNGSDRSNGSHGRHGSDRS
jgi:hypothetical protein